jgi:L-ascorbate metabolism protein UlaG (beta-lactamase superfamily)
MDPEQAALAADLLGADQLVPIHYDGYALPGLYEPVPDPLDRLMSASARATVVELGASIEI